MKFITGVAMLTLIAFLTCTAQSKETFTPATINYSKLNTLTAKFEKEHKELLKNLPAEGRKDYEEIYQQRWSYIRSKFEKKDIFVVPAAQSYLDSMLKVIVAANPNLQGKEINCYFSRSGTPNASYIGQGIILFNMGLFTKLENESQVAFVLSHELAHFLLQHSEKSIEKYVTDMNSKSVQTELRKIKKAQFNKLEKLEQLQQGFKFDSRRHSRDHESDADSLGLELLHNSKFNVAEALTALALLDKIDEETLDMEGCLKKMFTVPGMYWEKRWLYKDSGLLGGHASLPSNKVVEDSLKTHPDCQARIKSLEATVTAYSKDLQPISIYPARFDSLKKAFNYEIIEYAYSADNYTAGLFQTITMLQDKPDDPYLIIQVGRMLNNCYNKQKQHKLGQNIKLPSPGYPDAYNTLLQFIQNLYLEEYPQLSFHYLNQYSSKFASLQSFQSEISRSSNYIKN